MYCLSFDIDWASDEVIQYCIEKVIEAEDWGTAKHLPSGPAQRRI